MQRTILGFDIGGSKVGVIEGTPKGQILQKNMLPNAPDVPFGTMFSQMVEKAQAILRVAEAAGRAPAAISVSVGGPLDIEQGIVLSPPNLPSWTDVPLKARLQESLGLPVFVEHDGNAGALAEYYFGAGYGTKNMVFLTFGSGMGAGIILNGNLYRGTTYTAGEVGHVRISSDGPTAYGKAGSWESLCSGTGLVKLAHARDPQQWDESATARQIIDAAFRGHQEANALLEEMAIWLGRGIAMLVDILNPQVIVVGTLAHVLGERVLAPARRVVEQEALHVAAQACSIVPAALGEKLGDIAALMAAINAHPAYLSGEDLLPPEGVEVCQGALQKSGMELVQRPFLLAAESIVRALSLNKKILVFGNGGSAAQAQHLAGELLGKYSVQRKPLPAIALTADGAVMSCIANDFGYDQVFARQVQALLAPGDVAIGLTTSGTSDNVIQALQVASEGEGITIALTGTAGLRGFQPDHLLAVPGVTAGEVQAGHLLLIHLLCELVDAYFAPKEV